MVGTSSVCIGVHLRLQTTTTVHLHYTKEDNIDVQGAAQRSIN